MATSGRRIWTGEEMRNALNRLVAAAYGSRDDFPMHIPAQPDDADQLLADVIDEVVELRQHVARTSEESHHHWKVSALFDCHLHATEMYAGNDYRTMCLRVGEACLTTTTDKVFVYRDGDKIRHIEVR
jgi:hypothetical protein